MINNKKFTALISKEKTNTLEKNKERIKNRAMLRESQQIAIKVMVKLDELGWSQKYLAQALSVSPQQITKILSGKENLTIETQIKLQTLLDIPILASYYENKNNDINEWVLTYEKRIDKIVAYTKTTTNYQEAKTIKMETRAYSQENFQLAV